MGSNNPVGRVKSPFVVCAPGMAQALLPLYNSCSVSFALGCFLALPSCCAADPKQRRRCIDGCTFYFWCYTLSLQYVFLGGGP